jgi:hypothetical protein
VAGRAPVDNRTGDHAAALVPPPAHPPGIRDEIHQVFLTLAAAAIICWRHLIR